MGKANSGLSIISADLNFVGNLVTTEEIQLDGSVDGDIQCGAIILGESGRLTGTLTALTATIRGRIDGTVYAKTAILEKTAHVAGDVIHESITIEAGAHIEGRLIHKDNAHEASVLNLEGIASLKVIG